MRISLHKPHYVGEDCVTSQKNVTNSTVKIFAKLLPYLCVPIFWPAGNALWCCHDQHSHSWNRYQSSAIYLYSTFTLFGWNGQSISKRQGPVLKGLKNDMEVVLKLKASSSYSGATCFVLFCFVFAWGNIPPCITDALWAKRGEHGIVALIARRGEEKKNKEFAPSALLFTIWTPGTLRLFWPH